MIENLQKIAPPDPNSAAAAGQGTTNAAAPATVASAPSAATTTTSPDTEKGNTRLYVEQDGKGVYVYRLIDTVTGRLLAEVPREQVDQLKNSPDYSPGALVSTSA